VRERGIDMRNRWELEALTPPLSASHLDMGLALAQLTLSVLCSSSEQSLPSVPWLVVTIKSPKSTPPNELVKHGH